MKRSRLIAQAAQWVRLLPEYVIMYEYVCICIRICIWGMPARLFPKSFCYAVAITSIFLREEVRCLRRLHLNAASRRVAIILLNSTMRNNLQQQQQQLQLHCMLLQQLVLLLSHSASHAPSLSLSLSL